MSNNNDNPASSTPTVSSGAAPGSSFNTSTVTATVAGNESNGSVFQNEDSTIVQQELSDSLNIIKTNKDLAVSAASDAVTAKNAAEAALDEFDDIYLGAKSSDPSVDNDGNVLADGTLYFNTVSNVLKIYDLATTTWLNAKPTTNEQTNINTVAGNTSNINTVAGNTSNINTVADISSDVTAVANISTDIQDVQDQLNDIQTVASDLQEVTSEIETVAFSINDITTVAGIDSYVSNVALNSSNISTVAGINSDVTSVAGISSDVTTVAADGADIGTVAGISSDVSTVAGISSDVTTVANDGTDIGTVAGISSDVTTVSGISTNVTSVANVSSDVTTVADISSDVTAVANISQDIQDVQDQLTAVQTVADDLQEATSEIETVAASITNVDTVAGISGNVTTVAGISSDVTSVANVSSNVTTVAGISSDVSTVASDQTDIGTVAAISNDIQTLADIEDGTDATDAIQTVAGISSDVSTVSGISSNVTTVANNNANVTTVAGNNTNISTVAGINSDVTSVAGISSDVSTVAADGTDIGTVAGISTDVQTLADIEDGTNATNAIQTVSSISSDVTTVSGISSNVTTVANDGTDIGVVAGISADVQTLADIEDGTNATNAIQTVAGISSNVTTVAGISSNVTTVAGDSADIGVVSGLSGDIQTLADIEDGTIATNAIQTTANSASNVDTVAGSISNVNIVAGDVSDINTVAGISNDVTTVSGISGNVTTVAGINSDVTSVAGIASNVTTVANSINDVNTFATTYRIGSTDPTTSLDEGDLFYNTTDNALKYYDGSSWSSITAGLTDIVGDVTPQLGGTLDANGNTIDMGTNIITDAKVGEWDTSYGWGDHSVAGYLEKSGGTMTGALTLSGAPTANLHATTKAYVDALIAAGIHYHNPVRVESPDNAGSLNATYDNGTSGEGATLTNNGTQAALIIDGVTLATSDRVLIYNQTNAFENGIYTVTNTGSASTNWVLTRATDADSYGLGNDSLSEGTSVFVSEGDDGAGEVYACTTTGTITFGTTAINFSQIGKSAVISGGTSITVDSNTVSVTDNSIGATQLNVSGNGSSGQVLKSDGDGTFSWANDNDTTYSVATSSTAGIVKVGYAENGKNYPVELNNDQMFVNVPWTDTDTNTTYSEATSSTYGIVKVGYAENGKNYPVELASGQMYVNVPWVDTNTTYSTATSGTLGLVKTGYAENGKNYPVELSSGQMYVNVPWVDTNTTYSVGDGGLTQVNFTTARRDKLNGIESGATADQTAAEILTAIKTVDGSGSGLDADLLDGQQGSYYYPASNPNGYTTNTGDITGVTAGSYLTGGGASGGVTLNVDATTTATASKVVARDSSGDDYRRYGFAEYFNMSHGTATRSSDTIFYSSTDSYIRKNNAPGMRTSLSVPTRTGGDASGTWGISITGNADTVDSLHASSFIRNDTSNSVTNYANKVTFFSNTNAATTSGSQASLECYSSGAGNDAFMAFHVGGDYATYFGLDGDTNDLFVGGWSKGASRYKIWHAGNDGSGSGLDADNLDGLTWTSSGKNVRATQFYSDDWFRNYNSGKGLFNEATGQHWYSDDDDYWNIAGGTGANGIRFRDESGGTIRGYVYADNSNQIGFLDSDGNWAIRHVRDSRTEFLINNTEYAEINTDYLTHTSDIRTPIFYDSNNTAYYADIASTSRFNAIEADGLHAKDTGDYFTFYGDNSTSHSISSRSQHGGADDDIRINSYGSVFINLDSNNNNTSVADFRIGRHGAAGSIANLGLFDVYGDSLYAYSAYSFRSPIFYDSNNTGYYTNPASTSVLNDIFLEGEIYHNGDTNTYIQFHAADQWRVVTGGAERLEVNNSQITSTEPIYAPSFHGDGSNLTNLPGGGKVGQVRTYVSTSLLSTTSTSLTGSGISVSITPTSTASKILVMVMASVGGSVNSLSGLSILRGATLIGTTPNVGSRVGVMSGSNNSQGAYTLSNAYLQFLDSPSTTGSTTYEIAFQARSGMTTYLNRSQQDTDAQYTNRGTTSIIVMEILP